MIDIDIDYQRLEQAIFFALEAHHESTLRDQIAMKVLQARGTTLDAYRVADRMVRERKKNASK